MKSIVMFVLCGLLLTQVVLSLNDGERSEEAPYRLLTGDRLPGPLVAGLGDLAGGECAVVYFANPGCPGCRALAAQEMADSLAALWVFEGDPTEVVQFAEAHAIPPGRYLVLADVPGLDRDLLSQIGVFATPTTAVVLKDGSLWSVRVTTVPRSVASAEQLCQ